MTGVMVGIIRAIAAVNTVVGKLFAWLALLMVLVCFTVVVQRYVFATSRVWMQDLYVWLNGAMFTAVGGYALLRNDHVRVDIYYRPASLRTKAIIDLFGVVVFLLPFCGIVFVYGLPFVARSWRFYEGSANFGGMPGLFILKTFILVFAALIALQGIAMALRSILVLMGRESALPAHLAYPRSGDGQQEAAL